MATHFAVPVLARGSAAVRHVEVAPKKVLALAEAFGLSAPRRNGNQRPAPGTTIDALRCTLAVHTRTVAQMPRASNLPLTIVGSIVASNGASERSVSTVADDCVFLGVVDGLPGAFPFYARELTDNLHHFCDATLVETSIEDLVQPPEVDAPIGGISFIASPVHEAIAMAMLHGDDDSGLGCGSVIGELVHAMRRRAFTWAGMSTILSLGMAVDPRDLNNTFSYHCGSEHSVKQLFDASEGICQHFLPPPPSGDVPFVPRQGIKLLSPYGTASFVGASYDVELDCVAPFWHPTGAPAAQLAPLFHANALLLEVGWSAMALNGPLPSSQLLLEEHLSRYVNPTEDGLDTSEWLNEGLFGRSAGHEERQLLPVGIAQSRLLTVSGVRWDAQHNTLEQVAHDAAGRLFVL